MLAALPRPLGLEEVGSREAAVRSDGLEEDWGAAVAGRTATMGDDRTDIERAYDERLDLEDSYRDDDRDHGEGIDSSKAEQALDAVEGVGLERRDFAELALLCVDQAGASPRFSRDLRRWLRDEGVL